jgi:hypothetical protein
VHIYIYRERERELIGFRTSSIGRILKSEDKNGYHQGFIDSVINPEVNSRPKTEEKPLASVYIPYVKGVSENLIVFISGPSHLSYLGLKSKSIKCDKYFDLFTLTCFDQA